MGANKIKELW
jgi:hypothetical protein